MRDEPHIRIERGTVRVPECRDGGETGSIDLAWARLRADPPREGAPLVYLAEGPGVPALIDLERPDRLARWKPFLRSRDVVLFDQRGCGRSQRDLTWRPDEVPPRAFFRDPACAGAHLARIGAEARAHFVASGARLDGYTALESARDVDALAAALKLEAIALLGFSYGAQLALACLRTIATTVDAVVLAGVEGTGHAFKLPLQTDRYFASLGLLDAFVRAADALERMPAEVSAEHRRTGQALTVEVGRFGLALVVCRELYREATLAGLPEFLAAVARGEREELTARVRRQLALALRLDGMAYLVDGASGASAARRARIREEAAASRFGNAMNFPFPEIEDTWRPRDLGDRYRENAPSNVPALFVSGERDWNAPVEQAREVARGFPRHEEIVVPGAAHETLMRDSSTIRAMASFLDRRADR